MNRLNPLVFCLFSLPALSSVLPMDHLPAISHQYSIESDVLVDFVDSYNFKCPEELSQEQLIGLLTEAEIETDLSAMLESDQLESRDIYVEARSMIRCFTPGTVSKGY